MNVAFNFFWFAISTSFFQLIPHTIASYKDRDREIKEIKESIT